MSHLSLKVGEARSHVGSHSDDKQVAPSMAMRETSTLLCLTEAPSNNAKDQCGVEGSLLGDRYPAQGAQSLSLKNENDRRAGGLLRA